MRPGFRPLGQRRGWQEWEVAPRSPDCVLLEGAVLWSRAFEACLDGWGGALGPALATVVTGPQEASRQTPPLSSRCTPGA